MVRKLPPCRLGLKADISALHTVILLIIILIFAFTAYTTNENLGSPAKVYDLLAEAAKRHAVDGNAEGSYLTMVNKLFNRQEIQLIKLRDQRKAPSFLLSTSLEILAQSSVIMV